MDLNKDRITDSTIAILAQAIPGTKMETIAETYFGIQNARIKDAQEDNRGNIQGFNREVIRLWTYRQSKYDRPLFVSH